MVFVSVALSIVSVIPRLIHIIEQQTFDLYIEVDEGEWCDVGAEVAEPDRLARRHTECCLKLYVTVNAGSE